MNSKLTTACDAIYDWCRANSVQPDLCYDEDDTQGILIFKRDKPKVTKLLNAVRESLSGLYIRQIPVRAGTIILMSIEALTEHDLAMTLGDLTVYDAFAYKVNKIFDEDLAPEAATEETPISVKEQLMQSAIEMREAQYKYATSSLGRGGALSVRGRSQRVKGRNDGEKPDAGSTELGDDDNKEREDEDLITELEPTTKIEYRLKLDDILAELAPPGGAQGLQGLGAEHQPTDLFQRFAQAMQALGTALHLGGSLQDLLRKQGIKWKKSEDGQAIIFFVMNAATNAPQPLARVGYQTLGKPQEFQTQLMNVLDIAKGQAIGTEQQQYEAAQENQKQMRTLANQFAPPQEGQGAPGQGADQGVATPPLPTTQTAPGAAPKPQGVSAGAPAGPSAGASPGLPKPSPKPAMRPMGKPSAKLAKPKTGMIHTP